MFRGWRLLVAAAAVLLVALAGPAAQADTIDSEIVRISYEWNPETGEVEDYSHNGGALPAMSCSGSWDQIKDKTKSTLEERWELEYEFDHEAGSIQVEDARGAVLYIRAFTCGDVSYDASRPTLGENEATEGDSEACDDPDGASVTADAPATTEASRSFDAGSAELSCLTARGTGSVPAPGAAPFTGRVHVEALDGDGAVVAEATTCTMVGGSCWSGDSAGPSLEDDAFEAEATSLHCGAENLLGLPDVHPAGTFGCEAVLE